MVLQKLDIMRTKRKEQVNTPVESQPQPTIEPQAKVTKTFKVGSKKLTPTTVPPLSAFCYKAQFSKDSTKCKFYVKLTERDGCYLDLETMSLTNSLADEEVILVECDIKVTIK